LDGLSLAETRAVLASAFDGAWTSGNFTSAWILDANASEAQRNALTRILSGELGGDAATLAGLIGDMKGVLTAPIDIHYTDGQVTVRAGDLVEGAGAELKGIDGSRSIEVTNAHYPLPNLTAGKATKSRVKVPGLEYDHDGSGMWTGPFEMKG
jgi:hypothetical protein